MFIRPNEFEAQLAAEAAEPVVAPAYNKAHGIVGLALLLVIAPVMLVWLTLLGCWIIGAALLQAPARVARFLRDAAQYTGWLALR